MATYSHEFSYQKSRGSYTGTYKVKVTVSYSYNDNGTSTVALTKVEFKAPYSFGSCPVYGKVYINNTLCADFEGGSGNAVSLSADTYGTCSYSGTYSSTNVTHGSDGNATFTIKLLESTTIGDSLFCVNYSRNILGVAGLPVTDSKTISATVYTLSYNANGGSTTPSSQTKLGGQSITVASAISRSDSTASGYTVTFVDGSTTSSQTATDTTSYSFKKWNTNQSGTGTNYSAGSTYTADASATLYAQWNSTVTNGSINLLSSIKQGYTFDGWYTAASGGTKVGNGGDSYTPASNITLYARRIANVHAVTLTKGEYISSVSGGGSKSYGSSVTVKAVMQSATGYTYFFDGWYSGPTRVSQLQNYTFTMPDSDVSLRAKATRVPTNYQLTVTAGSNIATTTVDGVTAPGSRIKTVPYGNAVSLSAAFESNAAYNYSFGGWYEGDTLKFSTQSKAFYMPARDFAITAVASKTPKSYKLTISKPASGVTVSVTRTSSPNGGASSGLLANNATIYYGDVLKVQYSAEASYTVATHTINGTTFTSGAEITVSENVAVVLTVDDTGRVYIYDSNSGQFVAYYAYVYTGTEGATYDATKWVKYVPMVYTGTEGATYDSSKWLVY